VQKLKVGPVLFPCIIGLLFTQPVWAQDFLNHVTFGAGAGFTFPQGAIAAHTKTGFNFTATGGPRFDRRFSVSADFSLHYLDIENFLESAKDADLSFGSIMRVWSLTVNPSYEFIKEDRFSSYATGGYGLYNRRVLLASPGLIPAAACDPFWDVCVSNTISGLIVTGPVSTYKGGYNVGGGVTFGAHTKFFAEVRYHRMFTTGAATELIPLTFGIRW
jgi:opacity protein-like surface antigen